LGAAQNTVQATRSRIVSLGISVPIFEVEAPVLQREAVGTLWLNGGYVHGPSLMGGGPICKLGLGTKHYDDNASLLVLRLD
jgi:hypothetical protein